jgi:hypoxanthine phosphoribosyltransferase
MSQDIVTRRGDRIERVRPLITTEELQARIAELGAQIAADYGDKEVVAVAVLKGSFLFFADLVRHLQLPNLACDFLGLSSYGSRTESSGVVRVTSDLSGPVEGKHILIVEDIVDTGLTMKYLLENLATRRPASVQICTLLHKPEGKKVDVPMAYVGFTIENHFVVGYGLDYDERYRQLPHIGVMSFENA